MIDVAIIGGGVAGLSAAMYAGRLGLKPTIFEPGIVGGTITLTDIVENYPGFKSLTGQQFADKIKEHAMVYKPKILSQKVIKISKTGNCFLINNKYKARSVILATGTEWKKLNVPGEKELKGRGVHFCALCEGPFYKNKIVAVIGGADSAAKEALTLSKIAKKVYIIYRGDKIHPEPINLKRVQATKNIEIIPNTNVKQILGKNKVEKVLLDTKKELILDAVFIDVGHLPMTQLAKDLGVKLNKNKEVIADKLMQTNISGFFVAGDVSDTPFKQAITGASEGSIAAYSAYQYVSNTPLCTYSDKPIKGGEK